MGKLLEKLSTIAKEIWRDKFTGDIILSFNQGGLRGAKKYPMTKKEIIRI
jgi:hypothetical protein